VMSLEHNYQVLEVTSIIINQLGLSRVVCVEGYFPPHPGSIHVSDMLSS
jgi:hypothetical protein